MEVKAKNIKESWKICEVTKLFEINPSFQLKFNNSECIFKSISFFDDCFIIELSAEYQDPVVVKYDDLENVMIVDFPGQESKVEIILKNGKLFYSDPEYLNDIKELEKIVSKVNKKENIKGQ